MRPTTCRSPILQRPFPSRGATVGSLEALTYPPSGHLPQSNA
uniref:Uncharacterized protein n=1 Tax=Arundo donax TaxID=35708 RepID=A0A0A9BP07_ARUDO